MDTGWRRVHERLVGFLWRETLPLPVHNYQERACSNCFVLHVVCLVSIYFLFQKDVQQNEDRTV